MTETPAPAPADNLLGICHALGEDFGVNPLWLRVGFGVALLFNLEWTIGAYLALGLVVLLSRLLIRTPRPVAAQPTGLEPWAPRARTLATDIGYEPLRKAA